MKRKLLCQLLLAAALLRPAAAQLYITVGPYSDYYHSETRNSMIYVAGDGVITGGTQGLAGGGGLFMLMKENSISGGTQNLYGAGSRMELHASNAITGGDQYFYSGAYININQTNGASGGAFYLFYQANIFVSAANAITNKIVGFHDEGSRLSFQGAYNISLSSFYSVGNYGEISGAGGASLTTNFDGGTATYGGTITGPLAFIKEGTGTLALTNSGNTYLGTTTVKGGLIEFNHAQNFGDASNQIALDGGGLRWASGNTTDLSPRINLGAAGGTFDTNGNTVTLATALSGTGALVKTGSGFLRFTSSNTHRGDTTINGGVLILAGPTTTRGQLGGLDGSKITINSGNINLESNNALVGTNPFDNILLTINAGGLLSTENNVTILPEVVLDGGYIETASAGNFVTGNYTFAKGLSTAGTGKISYIMGGAVVMPTAVTVGTGDTLRIGSAIIGNNNLVKQGAGTLRLTGSSTFTGSTVIRNGSLTVAQNNALGAGRVRVEGGTLEVEDAKAFSNDVVLAGGTYRRTFSGSLAGKVNASSDLDGGIDTTARIRAGSLGATSTLVTSFSVASTAANDAVRGTDVYRFEGTGTNTFVLELSSASLTEGMLGWLENVEWVLAIAGNSGNTATAAMQDFEGSYDEFLMAFSGFTLAQTIGAYGFDQETHAAWAVLNHNSDFAVIPEPGTVTLLVFGAVGLMARRRRKQPQATRYNRVPLRIARAMRK